MPTFTAASARIIVGRRPAWGLGVENGCQTPRAATSRNREAAVPELRELLNDNDPSARARGAGGAGEPRGQGHTVRGTEVSLGARVIRLFLRELRLAAEMESECPPLCRRFEGAIATAKVSLRV
jgi:hypothetical protein